MSEYTVLEKDLAEAAGVSRSVLQKKRADLLTDGEDYGRVKNATAYTVPAASRLLAELGVASPANALERALRGLPDDSQKNAPTLAEVVRRFQPNTSVMECRLKKTGDLVLVKVNDNRMFNVGQTIPVKKSLTDIHFLDAPQPRRNGKVPGFEEPAE